MEEKQSRENYEKVKYCNNNQFILSSGLQLLIHFTVNIQFLLIKLLFRYKDKRSTQVSKVLMLCTPLSFVYSHLTKITFKRYTQQQRCDAMMRSGT